LRRRASYLPASDRLAFQFAGGVVPVDVEGDDEDEVVVVADAMDKKLGFSTGERQLKSLEARPTRGSICSTNGTPISTRQTRPRPTRWSTRSPGARGRSKSRTVTVRRNAPLLRRA
jgi:hypothetical protein